MQSKTKIQDKEMEMVEMEEMEKVGVGVKAESKAQSNEIPEFAIIPVEDKEERKAKGIPLHFIGLRYYTVQSFIEEAEKWGVSRAIPPRILKQFRWGDKIYLAIHTKREDENGNRIPVATVFGFFTIDGINLKASPRLHKAVMDDPRVHIVKYYDYSGSISVERGCGTYDISSAAEVLIDLRTLINIIEEHAKKFGEKFKIMATGRFYEILPVKLIGAPFTQNVAWVVPPEEAKEFLNSVLPRKPKKKTKTVKHVRNYKLRKQYNDVKEAQEELKKVGWF